MANAVYMTPLIKGSKQFKFPTLPGEGGLKVEGSAKYQDFDILNKGQYSFPVGPKSTEITVSGTFFGEDRVGTVFIDEWESPSSCIHRIVEWKNKSTPLNFKATGFEIDQDVTVKEFRYLPVGGHGDFEYTIILKEYKDIDIKSVGAKNTKKRNAKKKAKTVTIKKNTKKRSEGLAKLAKKYYKKASAWKKIYNKNKSAIEKAAKKHGRKSSDKGKYLYKGTKLIIP